jgi:hypothetical protein
MKQSRIHKFGNESAKSSGWNTKGKGKLDDKGYMIVNRKLDKLARNTKFDFNFKVTKTEVKAGAGIYISTLFLLCSLQFRVVWSAAPSLECSS